MHSVTADLGNLMKCGGFCPGVGGGGFLFGLVLKGCFHRCSSRDSESRSRDDSRLKFQSLGIGFESQVSSLSLGLELFSLDYIEVNQPSKPTDQSSFSVCSDGVTGINYMERIHT